MLPWYDSARLLRAMMLLRVTEREEAELGPLETAEEDADEQTDGDWDAFRRYA